MTFEHIYSVASRTGIENRCSLYNLTKKYFEECPKTIEYNLTLNEDCVLFFNNYNSLISLTPLTV